MLNKIVQSQGVITLLGAGTVNSGVLQQVLTIAPRLVCADGGADHAVAAGLMPEAVIGDLDSLSAATRAALPEGCLHHIAEQDSTDFDKALRSIDAPLTLAVGFEGSRADHHLATLHVMVMRAGQRCVLVSPDQVIFVAPPSITLDLPLGSLVSLFPMGAVTGTSNGLRWPIDGLGFAPDRMIGTSNEVTGPVSLTFDAPKILVILPRRALPQVVDALTGGGPGWPAV